MTAVDSSRSTTTPLRGIRKVAARRMVEAWAVPVFHLAVQVDMTVALTTKDRAPGATVTDALLGVLSLYAEAYVMPVTIQVLSAADLLSIRPTVLRGLADRDVRVARALLHELSERVMAFVAEIGGSTFATVRQRVARHLLDRAAMNHPDGELVAALTQQELADAVGTVREVVVRTLRDLRRDHVIETGRHGIRIAAPERLWVEAYPGSGPRWNTSP